MGEERVIIRFVFKTFLQQIFHQCPTPILVVAYTGRVDRFMYQTFHLDLVLIIIIRFLLKFLEYRFMYDTAFFFNSPPVVLYSFMVTA